MKKILSLFLSFLVAVSTVHINAYAALHNGKGTKADPFIITAAEEFDKIRENPKAYYILKNNIVLPPSYKPFEFMGTLVGDNETELYSITVSISKPESDINNGAGLFSKLSEGVNIKNIRICGSVSGASAVGGLAGVVGGDTGSSVSNCINEATVRATDSYSGGFFGTVSGTALSNLTNLGNIYGSSFSGGITGYAAVINIYLCGNYGNIDSNGSYVGGIVGSTYGFQDYSYNSGNVSGTEAVGGIIGNQMGHRNSSYLYNTGTITGESSANNTAGGIIGKLYPDKDAYTTLSDCVNLGDVVTGGKDFAPIFPTYTSIVPKNIITPVNCYYSVKKDDFKNGTEIITEKNKSEADRIMKEINDKLSSAHNENNNKWLDEIIGNLGCKIVMFLDSSVAVYKNDDGKAVKAHIDKDNINVTPKLLYNGVTFVPVGFISETLNAEISFDHNSKSVRIFTGEKEVILYIGSKKILLNGKEQYIDFAPYIENGRTMIPLRAVSRILGKNVFWDEKGLILISDWEIKPSDEFIEDAVGIFVISAEQINLRIKNAIPGEELVIKNGRYDSVGINIDVERTADSPLVIRAQTPGGVEFTGESSIYVTGQYIEIRDFYFNEARRETAKTVNFYNARNCRLTGCYFYKCGSTSTPMSNIINIERGSQYNRIDHNAFERSQSQSVGLVMNYSESYEQSCHNNRIDNNYWLDIRMVSSEYPGVNNGLECVILGGSWGSPYSLNTIVEYNRFENIYGDGGEGICLKTEGNTVRYNTFVNSKMSGISVRFSDDSEFIGNFLFNVKCGFCFFGKNHLFKDNYIFAPTREGFRSYSCPGDSESVMGDYQAINNCVIDGNIILYPPYAGIMLGDYYNSETGYINPPRNSIFRNNIFYSQKGQILREFEADNIKYENNIVKRIGSSEMGTDSSGFIEQDFELIYDGEILVPSNRKNLDKQGLISFEEAGPENKWWVPLLRDKHYGYYDAEPEKMPKRITPDYKEIYVNSDSEYNLRALGITAHYEDESLYNPSFEIPYDYISYSVVYGDYKIADDKLIPGKEGNGRLKLTYKGLSCEVDIKYVESAEYESEVLFRDSFDNGLSDDYKVQSGNNWSVKDGALINDSPSGRDMIINHSKELKGNYEFSCEVNLKRKNETTPLRGAIVLGYRDNPNIKYTSLSLGDGKTAYDGIHKCDHYWSAKVSELVNKLSENVTCKIKIRRVNDKLILFTDDVISAVYENAEDVEGRFGFLTYGNIMSVDNIKVVELNDEILQLEKSEIKMREKRLEATMANIYFEKLDKNGLYYRIYRNGCLVNDSNDETYFTETLINNYREFNYKVRAFDEYGRVAGEGNLTVKYDKPKDNEFFEISNVYKKSGMDESYVADTMRYRSRGLTEGMWCYHDRAYIIESLPERFRDCGYIKTCNSDKADKYFLKQKDDFIKFDINKSATVYVLSQKEYSKPEWLNGWKEELIDDYLINGSPSPGYQYSKHFYVEEGKTTTVYLGGYNFVDTMYQIIVRPDEMPEYIKIRKFNPNVL